MERRDELLGPQLSTGNSKLKKTGDTVGFGIPADYLFALPNGEQVNTCPSAGACKTYCYAKQGAYTWGSVIAARVRNLEWTMRPDFVERMVGALGPKVVYGLKHVRVHDSGDFYSQAYLDAWYTIARRLPELTFYAYTKQVTLDLWSAKPGNFSVVQSVGGRNDALINLGQPHALVFTSHARRRKAGYVDGTKTDKAAIAGVHKIGLVYHGTREMTSGERKYLDHASVSKGSPQ